MSRQYKPQWFQNATFINIICLLIWVITFFLACWISFAICIGLSVAGIAGIAYGYNYQMAEWLTFTRSDVTVYMRRGQFYDRPDVEPRYISRRTGDEEEVPQAAHEGGEDYVVADKNSPDMKSNALPASWTGVRGAANLVDKIHQFTDEPRSIIRGIVQDSAVQADISTETTPRDYYKLTSPSRLLTKLISITPNAIISTAIWKSGDSNIIMRNFQISTMKDIDPDANKPYPPVDYMDSDEMEAYKYRRKEARDRITNLVKKHQQHEQMPRRRPTITLRPDNMRMRDEWPGGSSSGTMIMRHWGPTSTPIFQEYTDDTDEDSIVYKPG